MSNDMIVRSNTMIASIDDAERAGRAMAASGWFADSKEVAQATVKIMAGHEMGFGPFASMDGFNIIQGRPAISAHLMAAAVKRSGRYNYRVTEMTDKVCRITFLERGTPIGESVFTVDDARKAGTKNMDRYARNMLFARAVSNGVRWYCPDVLGGCPAYTPEELGATVDGDGNVISLPVPAHVPDATPDDANQCEDDDGQALLIMANKIYDRCVVRYGTGDAAAKLGAALRGHYHVDYNVNQDDPVTWMIEMLSADQIVEVFNMLK